MQSDQQQPQRLVVPGAERFGGWSFETSVNHVRTLTRGRRASGGISFWQTRCCRSIAFILVALGVASVCWAVYEVAEEEHHVETWPWQGWCNQKLRSLDHHGCIVNARKDLPPVQQYAEYDVFYAIDLLSMGGTLVSMFNLAHSCLLLREKGKELGEGLNMVIEYAAVEFGPEVIAPVLFTNGSFKWRDDTVVAWFPWANRSKWINGSKVTRLGSVNGATLAKWFGEIPNYGQRHLGYAVWSVMNGEDVAKAWIYKNSSLCHDFTLWGMLQLHKNGAKFRHKEPLCRNYFALQTKSMPRLVGDELKPDMIAFYGNLKEVMQANFHNFSEFGVFLRSHFEVHGHNAYIHEKRRPSSGPVVHRYYKVELVPPFLSPNLYQRMPLPWQRWWVGDCSALSPESPPSLPAI